MTDYRDLLEPARNYKHSYYRDIIGGIVLGLLTIALVIGGLML